MNAVWQKIKADIASRKLISIMTVVTLIAGSTLLTLALATLMTMNAPYDQSFEELNAAHLWLHFDRNKIRSRDIERIETWPGVVESTGLRYSLVSRVRLGDTRMWVSLRATPLQQPAVNRLFVQEGRYLAEGQAEILAGRDLKDWYGLSVGDSIGITRWDGKQVNLPVIGLAYDPMWDTYRNIQPPYLYISADTMRDLFPDEQTWDWSMGLRLTDPQAADTLLAHIKTQLRPGAIDSSTDWRDVKRAAVFGARLNFIFLSAFSLFAILATILVITSSISAIVLSQFKQIGILKAIGFTQGQILALYIGQYLLLSLVSTPLGLLLGIALSPLPLKNVAASLSATFHPPFNPAIIATVMGSVAGVVVLATVGAAYRGARANIIKAIAVGAEPPRQKTPFGVRLALRLGLPMVFILGLNDVFARPFRSALTGINLTLGVIGIVFGLTLNETLNAYRADPSLLGVVYDAAVTREASSDSRTQQILRRAPGVEAYYGQYLLNVKTPQGHSFQVKAVEGDLSAFPFRIAAGRFFQPGDYEAIAGQGLLDWLGLKVGDTITVILEDEHNKSATWHIVGQYPEPVNTGQILMISLPDLAHLVKDAQARTYYLKLKPDANLSQLKRYLEPEPEADLNLTLVGQAIPSVVVYLQIAIFGLAGILIGIATVNVFTTSLLSTQEKLRSIGILKTLGMTPAQVIAMINTAAGVLGLLATALGIPLGIALTQGLFANLSATYGFGQVHTNINVVYLAAMPVLMLAVSISGSLLPARQAARAAIVSVLRRE